MAEQEIERCLERSTIGKATDVMNFDYAGMLTYLQRLKAENDALKERLGKAVELPVKVGDTVYLLSQTSRCPKGEIIEAKIIDFIGWKDGYRFTAKGKAEWFSFLRGDIGTWVFTTREAAEARLAELKGETNESIGKNEWACYARVAKY